MEKNVICATDYSTYDLLNNINLKVGASFYQENALVIANTLFQQHEKTLHKDITRWSTPKSD